VTGIFLSVLGGVSGDVFIVSIGMLDRVMFLTLPLSFFPALCGVDGGVKLNSQ
jgi:hypothetical protein